MPEVGCEHAHTGITVALHGDMPPSDCLVQPGIDGNGDSHAAIRPDDQTGRLQVKRSKRFLPCIAMTAVACLLVAGCSGVATREIEAERASLPSEPVSMNAKGLPEVSIDPAGAVTIDKGALALTSEQRALTRDYHAAVVELADLTLSGAAGITHHAMSRVLFATLIGRGDEAGDKIGQQADSLVHSPQFCHLLGNVQQSQDRMVQSVVTLQPYAKITPQAVANCVAGKPYDVSI